VAPVDGASFRRSLKASPTNEEKEVLLFEKKKQKPFTLFAKPPDQMGQSPGALNK
jgi:hypothetical protein